MRDLLLYHRTNTSKRPKTYAELDGAHGSCTVVLCSQKPVQVACPCAWIGSDSCMNGSGVSYIAVASELMPRVMRSCLLFQGLHTLQLQNTLVS